MRNMRGNTVTLAQTVLTVSDALRTPGIEIIAGLFPAEKLDTARDPAELANLYNQRIDRLSGSGLLDDPLQLGPVYGDMADARHCYNRVATSAGASLDAIQSFVSIRQGPRRKRICGQVQVMCLLASGASLVSRWTSSRIRRVVTSSR